MEHHKFILEIRSAGYSSSDDHWQTAIEGCRTTWLSACSVLNYRSLMYRGELISIEFDWRPAVRSCEQYASAMEAVSKRGYSFDAETWPFQKYRTKIPITLTAATAQRDRVEHFHPEGLVMSALADVFLILNVCDPGCCDFHSAKLNPVPGTNPKNCNRFELSFSSIQFEISRLRCLEGGWPAVKRLEVPRVADWYFGIRSDVKQVPQNEMERVLFAILHIAAADLSPTSVIWLYYALETLLDTKPGENRAAIERRASSLLTLNSDERKEVKRALNRLYDYRSSLVHGGLQLIHPLHSEMLDEAVDEQYYRLMDLFEIGFSVLLASVQTIADRCWRKVHFCERIVGSTSLS